MQQTFVALGLMSGTSLDGTDLAVCRFTYDGQSWTHLVVKATTLPYPAVIFDRLRNAHSLAAYDLLLLSKELGTYYGQLVNDFLLTLSDKPQIVASHGHTVFHKPDQGLTFQVGDGHTLFASCGIPVVCDFRQADVAIGGQGAPLVPIGDQLLFHQWKSCLNLGGFGNISTLANEKRIAWDISPVNLALNHAAGLLGHEFDYNGDLARSGKINQSLLDQLNQLEFYKNPPPKSLGREWFETTFLPLVNQSGSKPEDLAATLTEHIAVQLADSIQKAGGPVLLTGGGAFNSYLVEKARLYSGAELHVPDPETVQFKEAIIFAFLGLLKFLNKPNALASATGAERDSSGGIIIQY
jgi:anhydro-N-acetylmuramic acid kinase